MMAAGFLAPQLEDPHALATLHELDPAAADEWLNAAIAFLAELRSDDAPDLDIVNHVNGWLVIIANEDAGETTLVRVDSGPVRRLVGSGADRGALGHGEVHGGA